MYSEYATSHIVFPCRLTVQWFSWACEVRPSSTPWPQWDHLLLLMGNERGSSFSSEKGTTHYMHRVTYCSHIGQLPKRLSISPWSIIYWKKTSILYLRSTGLSKSPSSLKRELMQLKRLIEKLVPVQLWYLLHITKKTVFQYLLARLVAITAS